jgi:2-desacetyl-2-hydroxyethyl bacteriochlorophyllide A dehydrogenase
MSREVRIDEPESLRVVPVEPAGPGPGDAAIRVAYSGICGSDREVLAGTRPEGYVRYPVVPGHEWSGIVAAVGTGVDGDLVGKSVVGEGFRSCRVCSACRRGDNNLCGAPYAETGFTLPGAWADTLILPAHLLHVLPDGSDLRAAAALEPAACVAAACLKIATVPGERVAVVGGGSLGLLASQLLAAAGPAELLVIDPRARRGDLAMACGATGLLTPERAENHFGGFDAVLEAAGVAGTADLASRLVRPGGRLVLTGIPATDAHPLSLTHLLLSQITVHTVFGAPSRAWSHAVRAFASGAIDPAVIITDEFPLDEADAAMRLLGRRAPGTVKILLRP